MPHHPRRRLARDLTDAEEAEIQRRIALDPDNPELTDEQLAQMRPARREPPDAAAAVARLYIAVARCCREAAARLHLHG